MAGGASISGLASGLDTATIISQLMQLEAIPQSRLKTQVTTHESAVTKLQELNTKIAALFTKAEALSKPAGWSPIAATSSYDKVSVTTTTGAQPGSLSFTVLSTAKAHVLSSTNKNALSDVVVTGGGPLGGGGRDVRLTIGGTQHTINTGGGTLKEVVDAVNNADLGVRASALALGDGTYGLHVEATTTGAASVFTLTRSNGQALMGGMTTATAGTDASIKVGNHTLRSPTNTFTNVLPGVTVTLGVDAVANTNVTATMATDKKAMTETVKGLVEALNGVITDIDALVKTGDKSVKKGPLAGDAGLRQLRDQLLDTLYSAGGSGLSGVGIQLDRTGKFVFDTAKFETAYGADPAAVEAAFAKAATNTGFADRLAAVSKRASDSIDGSVTMAIKGRKSTIAQIQDNIERWDDRLALRQTTLTRQFTALETALGQMNSQSNWLAGQIASLPTMG
jgi:flagellar hook-associated protein 2